mmetsp:Transcript_54166/g.155624  ORF Transcript_54166/g.155624 Transcript_54166/m.155624 type:complete len:251 (-) Transcript_54166:100-852(-)
MSYTGYLEGVNNVIIKEKVNLIEAASALLGQEIEMANKYKIQNRDTGEDIFYAVEQTSCLTRQLKQCCGDCAGWDLDILFIAQGMSMPAMKMSKPWTATFLCCNRPVVEVLDAQSGMPMGSITDPCMCFNMKFVVNDMYGNPVVFADGGCCQPGVWLPLPCGPCSEISFDLIHPDSGSKIGELKKKVPGCLKFFLAPDVDNYIVQFYPGWDGRSKALVLALAIFMDFRLFSENPNDDDDSRVDQLQEAFQ